MKYTLTKLFEFEGEYIGNDSFAHVESLAKREIRLAVEKVLVDHGFRPNFSTTDLRIELPKDPA